jgi:hypothetical protein
MAFTLPRMLDLWRRYGPVDALSKNPIMVAVGKAPNTPPPAKLPGGKETTNMAQDAEPGSSPLRILLFVAILIAAILVVRFAFSLLTTVFYWLIIAVVALSITYWVVKKIGGGPKGPSSP